MKFNIVNSVKSFAKTTKATCSKRSPEICMIVGTVMVVAGFVDCLRQTTKASQKILEETKEEFDQIHEAEEHPENYEDGYSEQDKKTDLTKATAHAIWRYVKTYWRPVALTVGGVGFMWGSNYILKQRLASAIAWGTSVSEAFKKYRKHVVERYGEDVDHELRFGLKAKEVVETIKKEDGSEETVVGKIYEQEDPNAPSDYAKIFSKETTDQWDENPLYVRTFLYQVEDAVNNILIADKHIFLNTVYEMLGLYKAKSQAGQDCGWVYEPDNKNVDNHIDFGLDRIDWNAIYSQYRNGEEFEIPLDFNADGYIRDRVGFANF